MKIFFGGIQNYLRYRANHQTLLPPRFVVRLFKAFWGVQTNQRLSFRCRFVEGCVGFIMFWGGAGPFFLLGSPFPVPLTETTRHARAMPRRSPGLARRLGAEAAGRGPVTGEGRDCNPCCEPLQH